MRWALNLPAGGFARELEPVTRAGTGVRVHIGPGVVAGLLAGQDARGDTAASEPVASGGIGHEPLPDNVNRQTLRRRLPDKQKCRNRRTQLLTVARWPTIRPLWSTISKVSRDAAPEFVRCADRFR